MGSSDLSLISENLHRWKQEIITDCLVCADFLDETMSHEPRAKFDAKLLRYLDYDKYLMRNRIINIHQEAKKLTRIQFKLAQALSNRFYKTSLIRDGQPLCYQINQYHTIGLWKTKNKKYIWIDELNINHLKNIIRIFGKTSQGWTPDVDLVRKEYNSPHRQVELKELKELQNKMEKVARATNTARQT